jgi:uncharacterized protein YndB with AHSA1/START domain
LRVELTRTYPVPRKKAFDYLDDFTTWPTWYTGILEILEPDNAVWNTAGDKVHFAYRLLGRRLEGECTLTEVRDGELVKFTATMPMVGEVHQEWFYSNAGEDACTLKVSAETAEPTSYFGKVIDKMVIPRALERDLRHTLDNLEETFAMGIPT